jgi:hypothetical protein
MIAMRFWLSPAQSAALDRLEARRRGAVFELVRRFAIRVDI